MAPGRSPLPWTNSVVSLDSPTPSIKVWLFLSVSLIRSPRVGGMSGVSTDGSSNTLKSLRIWRLLINESAIDVESSAKFIAQKAPSSLLYSRFQLSSSAARSVAMLSPPTLALSGEHAEVSMITRLLATSWDRHSYLRILKNQWQHERRAARTLTRRTSPSACCLSLGKWFFFSWY